MASISMTGDQARRLRRFVDFANIKKEVCRYINEGHDFYTIDIGGFTVTFDATKEGVNYER